MHRNVNPRFEQPDRQECLCQVLQRVRVAQFIGPHRPGEDDRRRGGPGVMGSLSALSKAIGAGNFDWCINSCFEGYWFGADYDWGTQVVANMLNFGPTATEDGSWSALKSLY